LELTEVAPGIDVARDILAHMDFVPLAGRPRAMDARIFRDGPMGLRDALLALDLTDRVVFDERRGILFLNFEGLAVRREADVEAIRAAVVAVCEGLGRRVPFVVNYDAFRLDAAAASAYAAMVREMEARHDSVVSRYTSSAFVRMKLGQVLTRTVEPDLFQSRDDAHAFVGGAAGRS
jgi:propionate CoA-transferase